MNLAWRELVLSTFYQHIHSNCQGVDVNLYMLPQADYLHMLPQTAVRQGLKSLGLLGDLDQSYFLSWGFEATCVSA